MTDYYDHVLGLIPLALFGGSGALSVAGLELTTAVSVAGALAVLLVGHAMFVHGPFDSVDSAPVPDAAE
ncbi:hypothetical protein [Halospeciosus flavus]|uniref:Uncharacterized protein n=1 Tax=Halospeciosus flavus TaxID=3032283 RepID=A0ABD5Z2E6_9EURY|nr:hypothetical protein [Halospeciosus flavus]